MHRDDYIAEVLRGVRWKRAHDTVRRELLSHIEDQQEAYVLDGIPQTAAQDKAVLEMGEAAQVARDYDKVLRPRSDRRMLLLVAGLYLFSILFCAFRHITGTAADGWLEDAAGMLLGAATFAAGYFMDMRPLLRKGVLIYLVYLAGLLLCYVAAFTWTFPFNLDWAVGGYWLLLAPLAHAFLIAALKGKGLAASAVVLAAPWLIHGITEGNFEMIGRELLLLVGLALSLFAFSQGFFKRARYLPWLYVLGLIVLVIAPIRSGTFAQYFDLNLLGTAWMDVAFWTYRPTPAETYGGAQALVRSFGWGSFLILSIPYLLLVCLCLRTGMRRKRTGAQMICVAVALSLLMQFVCALTVTSHLYLGTIWPMPFVDAKPASTMLNLFQIGLVMGIGRMGTLDMG